MSRTCMKIRALQVAALAGVCLVGTTTALAQTKAKTSNFATKLRPAAKQVAPISGLKQSVVFAPVMTTDDGTVTPSGPAPRGPGGACFIPGTNQCMIVGTAQECADMFGQFQGVGSACPVVNCAISSGNCQNFEYPRVGGTSQASMGPGHPTALMVADDFQTDGAGTHTLSQICWWGAYTGTPAIDCNNLAPDVDHFFVRIFRMSNGLPDLSNVVVNAEQGVSLTVTRRGFCDVGPRLTYEYTATLSQPVNLDANTCYAIEIRNPNSGDGTVNWFWSRSRDVANNQAWQRNGEVNYESFGTVAGDRAFCLNVGLNVFQATCAVPPPPICSNPDANGQPFAGVNTGGFSASPSANAVGLQLAERVQFENSGNVTNVCFRGFWVSIADGTQPTGPATPDFDITYWENSNGLPGNQIVTYRVGQPGVNVFRNGFQYRIEHPALPVTAGTCYFFSISRLSEAADPDHNLRFAWWLTAPGAVGDDLAHSRAAGGATPGPWGNIAFGVGIGDIHFLMDGGPVQSAVCPATDGACCVGTTCSVTSPSACATLGGVFQGVGTICNNATCRTAPANDNCAGATDIAGTGTFNYDNRAATCEASELVASCGTSAASVWYDWTPACTGEYTISLCDQSVDDTILSVFDGNGCDARADIVCGDDTCGIGGGPSTVTFNATGGNHYLVRIASWNGTECAFSAGDSGTFTVSRTGGACGPTCPCDWNSSGGLNSQDFFDFLVSFFNGNADFNNSGSTNSQDFFDFLTCFFAPPQGC